MDTQSTRDARGAGSGMYAAVRRFGAFFRRNDSYLRINQRFPGQPQDKEMDFYMLQGYPGDYHG